MSTRVLRLVRDNVHGRAALDTAISHALLLRVAGGELPETWRLYRPERIVAFGGRDIMHPGFDEAVRAAPCGFDAVIRLAGGRAAVLHEGTLAFARAIPDPDPTSRTDEHFGEMAEILAAALRRLGVDARVGQLDGEYCPGAYSVSARGRKKLVGIGQRLVARGAHVGGVVVARGSGLVREILVPVYGALGLDWDPGTVGSVEEETGASWDEVETAVVEELASRYEIVEASLDVETLALAERLEPEHRPQPAGLIRTGSS